MDRQSRNGGNEDLFLELAEDGECRIAANSRTERVESRSSWHGQRRSAPTTRSPEDRRPRTSGQVSARPSSRAGAYASDLSRHVDKYRDSKFGSSSVANDPVSASGASRAARATRYSAAAEQSPLSPPQFGESVLSPDMPTFGRRRPSFGAELPESYGNRQSHLGPRLQDSEGESPAEASEPKRSIEGSVSDDSEPSAVWDELDDLKSRIKRIELGGKLPATSSAAIISSTESSERPKTATTAPTTIESSPKHERKADIDAIAQVTLGQINTVGGPAVANIHPLLHSALAKAKPLLNPPLYRTLEATAADVLQLAAMTGSAGPQGTAFSAASIINGLTVSDRHVRRKAENMCRNLTDLCLALCEGKHKAPSITASPVLIQTPDKLTPTSRFKARASQQQVDGLDRSSGRPMSRLDARRSSLGLPLAVSSRRGSHESLTGSGQDSTPSHSNAPEQRRFSRAGNRPQLHRQRYGDISGDEDPTIRPPSRAMTDIGKLRSKPLGSPRDYAGTAQQRSPSLRDALANHSRANNSAHDSNRELSRMSSLASDSGRRRFCRESTPPVLEEEGCGQDDQPLSQPRRRIASLGQYSVRRAADIPSKNASLKQRRHEVLVE